jgi:hypothetical protein
LPIHAFLIGLKRGRHVEDLCIVLNSHNSSAGETSPIAASVHFIDDRMIGIAGSQKVRVQRMRGTSVDRGIRSCKRLTEHLPTEDTVMPGIAAFTFESISIETL